MTAAVTALAGNSSAGVKAAFDKGIADLKTQLNELDLKVVVDDDGK